MDDKGCPKTSFFRVQTAPFGRCWLVCECMNNGISVCILVGIAADFLVDGKLSTGTNNKKTPPVFMT